MRTHFNTRDPIYVQVVAYFKEQIAKGILIPGQEIPSRRELANKLKINPNTVQRAYKEMEAAGLIFTEGNLPSKITEDGHILTHVRQELIIEAVNDFVDALRSIHVSLEDVWPLVQEKYSSEDET